MKTDKQLQKELRAPFPESDIKWRVQSQGIKNDKPWVIAIPYVTGRAIQSRLDDVFGVGGWANVLREYLSNTGFICGITAFIDNKEITKWDGAECTDIEPLKGGISNSMKRAAAQWGIGRYLYDLGESFADCEIADNRHHPYGNISKYRRKLNDGSVIEKLIAWKTPQLDPCYLPAVDIDSFIDAMSHAENVLQLRDEYKKAHTLAQTNQDDELAETFLKHYDKCKQEFQKIAAHNAEQDQKELEMWAKKEASTYKLIPNIESITNVYNIHCEDLKRKCVGKYVDKQFLQSILDDEFQTAKNQMEIKANERD